MKLSSLALLRERIVAEISSLLIGMRLGMHQ